jgi:membrane-bound lytic murein transglycosylase F
LALATVSLTACQPEPLPPPASSEKLVVAVRLGPTSWYPGPDGQPTGFDHDLLVKFAEDRKLKLEIVEVGTAADLLAKVADGEVHIGAGGLYRPPAGVAPSATSDDGARVLWTAGFFAVEPVLIYTTDGFKPKDWKDLAGATVGYVEEPASRCRWLKSGANTRRCSGSPWRCTRPRP